MARSSHLVFTAAIANSFLYPACTAIKAGTVTIRYLVQLPMA